MDGHYLCKAYNRHLSTQSFKVQNIYADGLSSVACGGPVSV